MRPIAWLVASSALLIFGVHLAYAQTASDPGAQQQSGTEKPAQVVTVFLAETSAFTALAIDGAPFGDLSMPADFPGVWPAQASTRKLTFKASGCEDTEIPLNLAPGSDHNPIL